MAVQWANPHRSLVFKLAYEVVAKWNKLKVVGNERART